MKKKSKPAPDSIKKSVSAAVDKIAPEIISLSRSIHAHPELNFKEKYSSNLIASYLSKKGFKVKKPFGGLDTAFRARFEGGNKRTGPVVALLAEYDALPVLGHACGHNMIGAISAGAAVALKTAAPEITATLDVLGTPAEEGGGGKIVMIKNGAFDGYHAAMMVHPWNRTRVDNRMYAMQEIEFVFTGKPAHAAATPHLGRNALDAVIQLFNSIGALRQQTPDKTRIHGIITDGGQAVNIIPERAAAKICVRALNIPLFESLIEKVKNCARSAAKATGCKLAVNLHAHRMLPLEPNPVLTSLFAANLESMGIKVDDTPPTEFIGSSDIGNVSQVVPAIHPEFAVTDTGASNHTHEFAAVLVTPEAEKRMVRIAKVLAMTAVDIFADPALTQKILAAFRRRSSIR